LFGSVLPPIHPPIAETLLLSKRGRQKGGIVAANLRQHLGKQAKPSKDSHRYSCVTLIDGPFDHLDSLSRKCRKACLMSFAQLRATTIQGRRETKIRSQPLMDRFASDSDRAGGLGDRLATEQQRECLLLLCSQLVNRCTVL
jgi:hypothetical protein